MEEYELCQDRDEPRYYREQNEAGSLTDDGNTQFFLSYTDEGNLDMDKEKCYLKDNYELVIENFFVGNVSVREILKAYLLEKQYNKTNISTQELECYNDKKNIIVASPKEVC